MKKILSLVLIISMLLSFAAPFTALAEGEDAEIGAETFVLADNCFVQTSFEISEETGANAKLFMLKEGEEYNLGEEYTDYIYGLDYANTFTYDSSAAKYLPTGTSADQPEDIANKLGAIIYTVDGTDVAKDWTPNPGLNLTSKNGNKYWNILGEDYLVNPEEKVIKLYTKVDASNCEDAELAASINTLNEVTFDVADGNYKSVGFLASAAWDRKMYVTLVYSDGTKEKTDDVSLVQPKTLKAEGGFGQANGHVSLGHAKLHEYVEYRVFRPHTVTVDETKTLDKVVLKSSYHEGPIFVISSWGKTSTPAEILSAYTAETVVNDENVDVVKADLENVNRILEANNYSVADLAETKAVYEALDASVKAYEEEKENEQEPEPEPEPEVPAIPADDCFVQTNFEMSEETGATSKLFMAEGAFGDNIGDNYTDFIPMVDYGGISKRYSAADAEAAGYTSGVGYYPTGMDTVITIENKGALIYVIDADLDNSKIFEKVNLKTKKDGDTYWNIDGVDYNINTEGKIIKLVKNVHTELIEDEAIAAEFKKLGGTTFDVVDGYYDSVGFLAGINYRDPRTFYYKLIYEDETTKSVASPYIQNTNEDATTYFASYGYVYNQKINPTGDKNENRSATGHHRYMPIELDTDPSKKLTAIEIIANSDWNAIYLISSWGKSATPASILSAYTTETVVNEENIDAVKADLEKVRNILDANDYNVAELVETKAVYDALYDGVKKLEGELAEKAEIEKLTKAEMDFIDISAAANSKVFVKNEKELGALNDPTNAIYTSGTYDYIFDFKQTYWWNSVMGVDAGDAEGVDASGNTPNYKWAHTAITTFKTDENNIVELPYLADINDASTLKYMTYQVDTSKEIIQIARFGVGNSQKMSTKATEAYKAKIDSMKTATVAVGDAYKSVYFLGSSSNGQAVNALKATIYYEGEEEAVTVKPYMYTDAELIAIYNKINNSAETKIYNFPSAIGYMGTGWYSYEIPTDSSKIIEKIEFDFTDANRQILIAGMTGVKPSISELVEAKKDVAITKENYEENKAYLEDLKALIASKNADIELVPEIVAGIKAIEDKLKAHEDLLEAEKLYKKDVVAIPLNGNAKVFVPKGTDLGDISDPANEIYTTGAYDYVLDFKQELWWNSTPMGLNAEDSSLYTWRHSTIEYEYTDALRDTVFPLKADNTFTVPYLNGEDIEYATYTINPEEKIISLTAELSTGNNQKLTEAAEAAYGEKLKSMQTATVPVEKGNYERFRFLASNLNGQAIPGNLYADVYYEGQEEPETVGITMEAKAGLLAIYNKIAGTEKTQLWEFKSNTGYAGITAWYSYEIPCDSTKKVEKITFRLGGSNRKVLIIAINGEKTSLADLVNEADATVNIYNYKAQEERAAAIEAMAQANGLDITKDAELLAEYNSLKEKIAAFNAIKETLEPAGVMDITYKSGKAPVVKVNVINPAVKEGTEFKVILSYFGNKDVAAGIYSEDKATLAEEEYEIEVKPAADVEGATKVKALIWKDLATLKPMAEPVTADKQ